MSGLIAKLLAGISLALKQPLYSYCDIETTHDDALVTKHGDYVSLLRVDGIRRMATRQDVARIALAQRVELSGALEGQGHAIVGWFASDPELSGVAINHLNLDSCRAVARELNIDLSDILDKRGRLWPTMMRSEEAYYVLWTRKAVLTKEERKQQKEEQDALARELPRVGDSQRFFVRSEIMAARHSGFVSRVATCLRNADVGAVEIAAHDALRVIRESLYRETAGSAWKPTLIGDRSMPICPEDGEVARHEHFMWPSIRSQIFYADAETRGGQRVQIGDFEYAPVDMAVGPEDPRPFVEISSMLGRDRIPWRAAIVIEGGGRSAMSMKDVGATFLSMFPSNGDLRRAFAFLRQERQENNHIAVKLRASFATWAPEDQRAQLRRRASLLSQRIEGWGNCKSTAISGDPLEGAMSSVPGLSLTSTGAASLALLGDAIAMLPWNRTASPWEKGSVLFRRPDGAIWPYDPIGGSMRPLVLDIFVAPPRSGKSVLANTINLGLCLSTAVMGGRGAKLPLIGKVDIGPSAKGLVELLRQALGPDRQHEAVFSKMQFVPGYEVNIFDLQVGCEYPLQTERAFLQNALTQITLPPDTTTPFEGIPQMLGLVIDEAYRLCTEIGGSPKVYKPGVEPEVDACIADGRIALEHEVTYWRDVVNALIDIEEYRLAEIAQRHAVPIMQDLVTAARSDQVRDSFKKLQIGATTEDICTLFERYLYDFIRKYPTLNSPSRLDFGSARVTVLDLADVAPTGSAVANRQTELMFLIARHLIGRNFFLHPEYAEQVPLRVRDYHRRRFQEILETVKRFDYDEWHRTKGSPLVQAQAERDAREGGKLNLQLGFSSQLLSDMGDGILSQATGRFILRAADEKEAEVIISRFNLSDASASAVRFGLHGPGPGGAPFLAVFEADGAKYEQLLVNSIGPIELWALSTTPADTALRDRLYAKLGFSEALRRLARIFPRGSAQKEIERRKSDRLTPGELDAKAENSVVDELARELTDGVGLGMKLRDAENDNMRPVAIAAE